MVEHSRSSDDAHNGVHDIHGTDESDKSLMARIQNGDHKAFEILVNRYTGMFFTAAYRMCSHKEEAEDIVQEAFLKLWRNPHSWDSDKGAKFSTWFYRVITNQALDQIRKKRPEYRSDILDNISDNAASDQHKELEDRSIQDDLESAIQSLPPRQKAALNLCFYEGVSNKEAADILGVGIKAVESLLMRAKSGLRDAMARRGYNIIMEKNKASKDKGKQSKSGKDNGQINVNTGA